MPDELIPRPVYTSSPETGFAFALSDESFSRWWAATVLPEDATEFVHLLHGTIEEARYVCAIDYITNVEGKDPGADVTVRAYFLAANRPVELSDPQGRLNAIHMASTNAVKFLLDRVRLRSRRIAEERIAARTVAKIEELYERSSQLEGKEQLDTERAALETSIKLMGNQARERQQESDRRAKKAAQDAITRSREQEGDMKRLPSLAEARLHLAMLVDGHGEEAIAALVKELSPRAIDHDTHH